MKYKPHGRRTRLNHNAILEIIFGAIAWGFVCFIMIWAVMKMLEEY
jgi:hypothetical protein